MNPARNRSLRPPVSFQNFDPAGPRDAPVDSPRSLAVCELFAVQPQELFILSKKELLKEFRKELRRMLEIAGFQGKKVCMYLETHHILLPSFLEIGDQELLLN